MRVITVILLLLVMGCGTETSALKGEKGDKGDTGEVGSNGQDGTSKIVRTILCGETITGLSGNAATALNGLFVIYKAAVMSSGDVWAVASVSDILIEVTGSSFFSVNQVGADTGAVIFVADYWTANSGYWTISANRSTKVMTAKYTDSSLGVQSPVIMNFASSACTLQNF